MARDPEAIVVAMTTCDGGAYLGEQLRSIARQTRPPDALVVSDDASRDDTLDILAAFRREAPFPVTILMNPERQGVHRNSDRAMEHAAALGAIVIPCDHDDVWDPAKVEALEAAFADDPRIVLWFSDAELIDETGNPSGVSLSEFVSLDDATIAEIVAGGGLRRLSHGWTISGGTAAVRSWIIPHVLPTPRTMVGELPAFHQDGWLVLVARVLGEFAADPRPLLRYRRHSAQLSHPRPGTTAPVSERENRRRFLLTERVQVGLIADRVRRDAGAPWVSSRRAEVLGLDRFLGVRVMTAGQRGRRRAVIGEVMRGSYRRYARGLRTAVYDLSSPVRAEGRADG